MNNETDPMRTDTRVVIVFLDAVSSDESLKFDFLSIFGCFLDVHTAQMPSMVLSLGPKRLFILKSTPTFGSLCVHGTLQAIAQDQKQRIKNACFRLLKCLFGDDYTLALEACAAHT